MNKEDGINDFRYLRGHNNCKSSFGKGVSDAKEYEKRKRASFG